MARVSTIEHQKVTLVEVLDRVLHKGAIISGEVTISVADVELIRLALQLVIASSGTLLSLSSAENGQENGNSRAQ
jgi:hypothetical protein